MGVGGVVGRGGLVALADAAVNGELGCFDGEEVALVDVVALGRGDGCRTGRGCG